MFRISANDLKTRGVAAIEAALSTEPEAIVSARGRERYVVMDIAHYHYLRECEMEMALPETRSRRSTRCRQRAVQGQGQ